MKVNSSLTRHECDLNSSMDLNFKLIRNLGLDLNLKAKLKSFSVLDLDMLISEYTNLIHYLKYYTSLF